MSHLATALPSRFSAPRPRHMIQGVSAKKRAIKPNSVRRERRKEPSPVPDMARDHKNQGGRRCFSPREITTLVGGPGNMAIYRHILVIPPTAEKVTVEKRKIAYRQNITAVLYYRQRIQSYLGFTASAKKVPPTLNTAKRVPPTLDTAQKVLPTLEAAEKVPRTLISPKRYRRYWIPPKRYRVHWIPPKRYRLFFSCSFFVLCSFWLFGFLFGRNSFVDVTTERHPVICPYTCPNHAQRGSAEQ